MATGVGKSNYLENAVLNHFLKGGTAVSQPSQIYIGLFSDATGLSLDQPTTEMVGTGYTRQTVSFSAASNGSTSNSGAVTFTAGGTWPAANYVGVFDASTAGNLLYWGPLTTPATLANTNQLQFAAGQIVISED